MDRYEEAIALGDATWPVVAGVFRGSLALLRAGNGDLLAPCRTDVPRRMKGKTLDHYEGLGISISKDDGRRWSAVKKLYDYGRHHPSLVLMSNQDIVMTYVVRLGYVDDQNGFPQFGKGGSEVSAAETLDGKIAVDFDTARRLFTLICVLHIKG